MNTESIKLKGNHKWLNFARLRMNVAGEVFPTNEHFFQHLKSLKYRDQVATLEAFSPRQAKAIGRSIKLRDNWEEIKFAIMVASLLIKFSQHENLCHDLLATGNQEIVEDRSDPEWGIGPDGHGRNLMGKALMTARSILRDSKEYGRTEDG
jgi:ribA/ribD-fused uncharacterized protein